MIQKKILLNLASAGIAGGLVFLGAFVDGKIDISELIAAFGAGATIFMLKIREFVDEAETDLKKSEQMIMKVLTFI